MKQATFNRRSNALRLVSSAIIARGAFIDLDLWRRFVELELDACRERVREHRHLGHYDKDGTPKTAAAQAAQTAILAALDRFNTVVRAEFQSGCPDEDDTAPGSAAMLTDGDWLEHWRTCRGAR
jgi:hypothetical protein